MKYNVINYCVILLNIKHIIDYDDEKYALGLSKVYKINNISSNNDYLFNKFFFINLFYEWRRNNLFFWWLMLKWCNHI